MHRALLAVLLIGLVVPGAAGAPPAPPHPRTYELGNWDGAWDGEDTLQEIDPATGRHMGRMLRLRDYALDEPILSPDRKVVAFGSHGRIIRVDLARWRLLEPFRPAPREHSVNVISWTPDRLIAVSDETVSKYPKPVTVRALDPRSERVTGSTPLGGMDLGTVASPDGGAVVLTGPYERIGTASLHVVDATGAVRSVALDGVAAGWAIERRVYPGLAVDFAGRRAFVFTRDKVAEVDLTTLGVTFHALTEGPRAPLGRPQHLDNANSFDGWERQARWLGNGRIALSGRDYGRAGPQDQLDRSAGLRLIDTQTWAAQLIDVHPSSFEFVDDTLLTWLPNANLAAFTPDGRPLYQRRKAAWHVDHGRLYFSSQNFRVRSLRDIRTGAQISRWKVDINFDSAFTLP